jgi:signal transduction histidine kinase
MKIANLIFLSFIFVLVLFSITTYINFRQSEEVTENTEFFARSTEIVRNGNRFQRNILNMVSCLRGYLLTGEEYLIQAYDTALKENESILRELPALITNTDEKRLLNEISSLNNQWIQSFATPLIEARTSAERSEGGFVSFEKLYREKLVKEDEQNLQTKLQQKFREFSNYEYQNREVRKQILDSSIQGTKEISFYLTMFSVVMGLLVAGFVAHRISTRIVRMVNMADSIASGNYNAKTDATGKDELGRLALALNHMAWVLSENITLLKRKNEELDQFAHVVSHDLKAPLRGIDNVLTWIDEDLGPEISPKMREYLGLIKGRVNRSENLIQGMLSYARVGKEKAVTEEVNLNQMVQEIWESLSSPGTRLSVPRPLPVLQAEKVPLMQVFSNLISNAVKYHDKPQGEITVYHEDRGTHYEFFVKDNGPGISKNYHGKIFVIFQTLQERDSFESTGVGLAIVKKILDTRGEQIRLVSEPGKGSVFSFTWIKA